jgi:hypothetical protein
LTIIVKSLIGDAEKPVVELLLVHTLLVASNQHDGALGGIEGGGETPDAAIGADRSSFMFACRDPYSVST